MLVFHASFLDCINNFKAVCGFLFLCRYLQHTQEFVTHNKADSTHEFVTDAECGQTLQRSFRTELPHEGAGGHRGSLRLLGTFSARR